MAPRGDVTTVGLRISGRVQGVWYRDWTVDQATELGLAGWVRNVTDGTVDVLVNGPKERVDQMIEVCRKGPRLARVDDVAVTVVDQPGYGGAFPTTGFQKLGTHNPADMPDTD
ncbi:MAG: acylphosphatase [Alphaproteobacteria bacterium]|nr:acylphosphatase [Alphaproteobacteria bacterium]